MIPDVGPSESRRWVEVRSALDVCSFVEDLDGGAVGELVLAREGEPVGRVFIEAGRICWVMARGLARRFTELLVAHTEARPAAVEQVVLGCLDRGAPLGEELLAAGLVTAAQLRSTLLQHAAESLAVACASPTRGVWQPRRQRGYTSTFTFTTAEILTCTLATEDPPTAEAGRARIEQALERGDCGVAFARRPGRGGPAPLALTGAWPTSTRTLLRIGQWAASAIDVASDCGSEPLLATTRRGTCLVAWPAAPLLLVGLTTELGAARILTRRVHEVGERGRHADGRV